MYVVCYELQASSPLVPVSPVAMIVIHGWRGLTAQIAQYALVQHKGFHVQKLREGLHQGSIY
jgi:hypothetical protein